MQLLLLLFTPPNRSVSLTPSSGERGAKTSPATLLSLMVVVLLLLAEAFVAPPGAAVV